MKSLTCLILKSFLLMLSACKDKPADACFHVNELRRNDPAFNFEFTSCSPGAEWFEWDFGDSTTSNEVNPEHVYGAKGEFTVVLTAYEGAQTTTFSREITIGDYGLFSYTLVDKKLRFEQFEEEGLNCTPDLQSIVLRIDNGIYPKNKLPLFMWNNRPEVDVLVSYNCSDGEKQYSLVSDVPFNLDKILLYKEVDFIDTWTGSKITLNLGFGILPEPQEEEEQEPDSTLSPYKGMGIY